MLPLETIDATLESYNRFRAPMATATLERLEAGGFIVTFEGPFCRMCCAYDYIDDLRWEFGEYGVDPTSVEIEDVGYRGGESYRARFTVG